MTISNTLETWVKTQVDAIHKDLEPIGTSLADVSSKFDGVGNVTQVLNDIKEFCGECPCACDKIDQMLENALEDFCGKNSGSFVCNPKGVLGQVPLGNVVLEGYCATNDGNPVCELKDTEFGKKILFGK